MEYCSEFNFTEHYSYNATMENADCAADSFINETDENGTVVRSNVFRQGACNVSNVTEVLVQAGEVIPPHIPTPINPAKPWVASFDAEVSSGEFDLRAELLYGSGGGSGGVAAGTLGTTATGESVAEAGCSGTFVKYTSQHVTSSHSFVSFQVVLFTVCAVECRNSCDKTTLIEDSV